MSDLNQTTPQKKSQLLVFDSGIGGLSIVRHIRQNLSNVCIDYLADNQWFPYGLKDDASLTERICALIKDYCNNNTPDIVIIACNTASTIALDTLRKHLSIPVVGVVPAIKPAAAMSRSRVIGLLATPGTIKRRYTDELIENFASDCKIIRIGTNELVQWIEQKYRGTNDLDDSLVRNVLSPFLEQSHGPAIDTIVLACTHFPLVLAELTAAAPLVDNWVDSGAAIARRVTSLLENDVIKTVQSSNRAWFTDIDSVNSSLRAYLKEFGFNCTLEFKITS